MFTNSDYLMRVIEDFCDAALRAVHLLQENRAGDALEVIDAAMRNLAGADPKLVEALPADEIIKMFEQNADRVTLFYMADCLRIKAQIYRARKKTVEFERMALKSQALYEHVLPLLTDQKLIEKSTAAIAEIHSWFAKPD